MSIELETRQSLFRYGSEWNPKAHAQTKGGYIQGIISVPPTSHKVMKMTIETFPVDDVPDLIKNVHPLILHLVKLGKGKREQDKEPVPNSHHWKLDFIVRNGKVYIQNRTSALDVNFDGSKRNVPMEDLITEVCKGNIVLGGKRGQLNLVILTPKQDARAKDASEEEATVGKVLEDRVQQKNPKVIADMAKVFKNANYMKKVRLQVQFYVKNNNTWETIASAISPNPIIDIGSKDIGALELYDVSPLKSCSKGGRKIVMVSEYDLAENTMPVFQVWKNGVRRPEMEHLLRQPAMQESSDRTLCIRKSTVIFLTPAQPNLKRLEPGSQIRITLRRGGDGQFANNSFNFFFEEHNETKKSCIFCHEHIDSNTPIMIQNPPERAKPGNKKKLMKGEQDSCPSLPKKERSSSVSLNPYSPVYSPAEPKPKQPASVQPIEEEAANDVERSEEVYLDYYNPQSQESLASSPEFVIVEDIPQSREEDAGTDN